ncbi:MAG: restriction endonuclease subunit S [Gemmatimonadetes bacterium]|nr:restriction endonuclease subunit S [Gemmatimonadota bacterium]MYB67300.1 restriction endonuclease subunit S [Gemmatimonadota bacterium]
MTANASSKQWPIKRLRYLTSRGPSDSSRALLAHVSEASFLPMEAIGEQGQLDLSRIHSIENLKTGYSQFFDGDVVIAKITPCFENGKGALIQGTLGGVGFGTTELYVLTPEPELDGRFLYYVTVDPRFRKLGESYMTGAAGQQRVPEDFVRDFQVPIPDLSQQRIITDYLDHETARLDALVAEKERLLDLLAEKRNALITRSITRGLDPNVPFRDSGISWLGEIPAHWETERAKWLSRERDERSDTGEEDLLTVSHLTGVTLRSEKDVNMFEAATKEGYKICLSGDLVINTMWAWMGAMGVSSLDGIVSPAYNVYELRARLDPSYVDALVRLSAFAQEVTRYSKGVWSSRLRLYPEGFFAVSLPVPPLSEQREIVAHIENETCKLDGLRDATERTTVLLKERRAALIAAAVTGHIDIGNP